MAQPVEPQTQYSVKISIYPVSSLRCLL